MTTANPALYDGAEKTMTSIGMKMRLRGLLISAAWILAAGCSSGGASPRTVATGQELFDLCVSCHGPAAGGNQMFNAPSIAGMPQWYLERQLHKFKDGVRGTHFDDLTGMQMRPMAISLANDGEITAVAAYVAALPKQKPAAVVEGGDAARGQALFAPCSACHGPTGAGNEQLKAPPLNVADDWYLGLQIHKFKSGIRGANPRDAEGALMRPMAATLSDDQAIKDVVAYIVTLK